MENLLLQQACGPSCQEVTEFSLKFIITELQLTDKGKNQGFEDILLAITFDGSVFKIDNFVDGDEEEFKSIGREMVFQLSPEQFSKKLSTLPIMLNLSRACNELGTVKLDISKCFVEAVKCEEFLSETSTSYLPFTNDGTKNASMTLVLQVSRAFDDTTAKSVVQTFNKKSGDTKKALVKKKSDKKSNEQKTSRTDQSNQEVVEVRSSFSDGSDSTLSQNLSIDCDTDLYPMDEQSKEQSSSTFSLKLKSIQCCSDILESNNFGDFTGNQKIFCEDCGGYSVSGITCSNREMVFRIKEAKHKGCETAVETNHRISSKSTCSSPIIPTVEYNTKCETSINRICSECFEDLTVIPRNAPCSKCAQRKQLQRKLVSLKTLEAKDHQAGDIKDCIKSVFEEIFLDTKEKLNSDWKRLKRKKKPARKSKSGKKQIWKKSNESNVKSNPRCSKLLNGPKTKRRRGKLSGLVKKHPGVILGHRKCKGNDLLVPKNMGWLWNINILGLSQFRRGWRPGAIKKSVAKIMKYYLTPPAEPSPIQPKSDPPTLRVQKKEGEYTIIMNPLQDELSGIGNSSPIVFKVVKSNDAKKRSLAKKLLKTRGVEKNCDCSDIEKCLCLTNCDKAHMLFELQEMSTMLCLKPELNFCDLKDSSESEIDIQFTPPSAAKLKNSCKPLKKSYAGTQYEIQEDDSSYGDNKGDNDYNEEKKLLKGGKKVGKEADKALKAGKKTGETKTRKEADEEGSVEAIKSETPRPKRKKQVIKFMRDLSPPKSCCSHSFQRNPNSACQTNENFRFTTNYNPMYAQCPPHHHQNFCMHHQS